MQDLPPEAAEPEAIPAATVVILRERPGGAPDLLMVERSARMAFAAGAWVFPGGRVDPGDRALANRLAPDDADELAHVIAAIRETMEETGIAIGLTPLPSAARAAAMRADLLAGETIGATLSRHGSAIDRAALVPFARWRPTHRLSRVFDARFYLARLPDGAGPGEVDGTENVALRWLTADEALAAGASGAAQLIFPTRRNLERLALFDSHDAAVADARAHPVTPICPVLERRADGDHLCIPAGLGYPRLSEPVVTADRG